MEHPFQRLSTIHRETDYLLAACESDLLLYNVEKQIVVTQWTVQASGNETNKSDDDNEINRNPPTKKRKLDKLSLPVITEVKVSPNQEHIILVTGEDKAIHVLQLNENMEFNQLSYRQMSKRPSAITFSKDNQTVYTADKFGDVYELPLAPTLEQDETAIRAMKDKNIKSFKPSASELTVHSKANLKSLELQRKKAEELSHAESPTKEVMQFAHELIIGHVSMLTDIVIAYKETKPYIITSDRDEHIRISRGPSQSYIIERFCFGHTEFVNRLCLFGDNILISGGGDKEIYIWNWTDGSLINKIDLCSIVSTVIEQNEQDLKIAVTGIWIINSDDYTKAKIVIACEGVPAVFYLKASLFMKASSADFKIIRFSGNILDVAIINSQVIISIDNIHAAGSTETFFADHVMKERLIAVDFNSEMPQINPIPIRIPLTPKVKNIKKLQTLLYYVQNLRKRLNETEGNMVEE